MKINKLCIKPQSLLKLSGQFFEKGKGFHFCRKMIKFLINFFDFQFPLPYFESSDDVPFVVHYTNMRMNDDLKNHKYAIRKGITVGIFVCNTLPFLAEKSQWQRSYQGSD